jgi:hypothetical protein
VHNRARILVGTLVGLTLLLLLASSGRRATDEESIPGSTYASGPDGSKAAYLMLERLGYPVERSTAQLGAPEGSGLVFLIAPQKSLDAEADLDELATWIQEGGTLVYAPSVFEPDSPGLQGMLGLRVEHHVRLGYAPDRVPLSSDYAPARTVAINGTSAVKPRAGSEPLRTGVLEGNSIAERSIGRGRAIVVADPSVFSNVGLREADNALLLATLCAHHGGSGPILFEERTHGFANLGSVLPFSKKNAVGALVLALAAALLYGFGAGVRLGPPSAPKGKERRASTEQITALGRFYERAAARTIALRRLGQAADGVHTDAELVTRARATRASQPRENAWDSSTRDS